MSKSCLNCPSYLTPPEASRRFGRSLGTAQCARYMTPLEAPRKIQRTGEPTVGEFIAERCDKYGEFRPDRSVSNKGLQVATPDPTHMVESDATLPTVKACTACTLCKHFVDESIIEVELGFSAGLCKARGQLVPANAVRETARLCEYRTCGTQDRSTDGMMILPPYGNTRLGAIRVPDSPVGSASSAVKSFEDPSVYETDREVTDDETAEGIRAWRRITDPDVPSRETYLPIFDPMTFSPEDRALIPQSGDDEHPELYQDHAGLLYDMTVQWRELDETPALWGEPGVGKTELARHMAWAMQLPFVRVSITSATELDSVEGKMMYDPERGTYFQPGVIPVAWAKPCVLLVDEPNTGRDEVWHFLRPLTDNSRQLIMYSNDNSRIQRDNNCYLVLAMNPSWDSRNRGVQDIADADASRLTHIYMQLPPEEVERKIIADRVRQDGWEIDAGRLDLVMKIAGEIRALIKDGTLPISWGIRTQLQVARALRWYAPQRAYRRAAGDFMEPEAADALLDVVRAHAPSLPF